MMLAERRMPQAEAMHLLTSRSKKLKYNLGGTNFETSYLRILKDDCSAYNFPSVKQLPSIETFPPSTTKTTARPTTMSTATTRPTATTTTTSTTTTTTQQTTTTTRAPPTAIAQTTQKKVPTVPSDQNLNVNAQNAFPGDPKRCACFQNIFSYAATSLCPRRSTFPNRSALSGRHLFLILLPEADLFYFHLFPLFPVHFQSLRRARLKLM